MNREPRWAAAKPLHNPLMVYGITIATVLVALVGRWLLDPFLMDQLPYVTFFVAVAAAAWLGGVRPALLATVMGLLLSWYFFVPSRFAFALLDTQATVGLAMYLMVSFAFAGFGEAMLSAQHWADERREMLRMTLVSVGDAVISTDTDTHVIFLNAVAEALTGWSLQEAAGQPLSRVFNIVNDETRHPVENPAQRALQEGIIVGLANHTVLIAKDGVERFIDDSAAPIRDGSGKITGAVLVFRDISEKYRSERDRKQLASRLHSLIQNAPIGIALFDTDLRYIDLNARAAVAPGVPIEDHVNKSISEMLPGVELTTEAHLARVRDTGEAQFNIEITEETQTVPVKSRHWIASYYPVRDEEGKLQCIGAVGFEITERMRAEAALQKQYDLTKAITDNATTAIFMLDRDSRCTFMNPAAEAMIGFAFSEIEGVVLHDVVHKHRDGRPYPIHDCVFHRAMKEHFDIRGHEDVFVRKNGEFFPAVCNARPIYERGQSVGTVIEVLDLTQQKLDAVKLRDSESRFLQLANSIPQLAWIAQPDGEVYWYNDRWYEYTGTTSAETDGWGWLSRHDPETTPHVVERWRESLHTGETFDMVFPLRGGDGEFRPFLTRIMPFRDEEGRILRWFGTNTDISEQQRIQEELSAVAARLSEADQRKDEFLATLAHELRNPLAPIRTGLEVLKLTKDDPAKVEKIRLVMERQTKLLITLVDDLLDVSRITWGKLELRKCQVQLADVVRNVLEASQSFVDEAGHKLIVEIPENPIQLNGDPNRLTQIFSNLLNNAAKYTPSGGQIWLKAECEGSDVVVTIQDNGIGIPLDMQTHIFEMFGQIQSPTTLGNTGLGIGLTLVKSLVDMHGGVVEVYSEGEHKGAEFRVRLPILGDDFQSGNGLPLHSAAITVKPERKVLVVDDNNDAASTLSLMVKMLGNDVRVANNGEQAIRLAAEFVPDVVIMDLGMPIMNGYDAARHIRQQPWGQRMMLVALSGWGQEHDKQRTREAGFDFHLVKPAEPSELEKLFASA